MEHGALFMQQCGLVSHLQTLVLVSCRVFFTAAAKKKRPTFQGQSSFYHAEFKKTLSSFILVHASYTDHCKKICGIMSTTGS